MSHRVTYQTEINEKEFALAALRQSKIQFREQGDTIHLQGSGYDGSSINLKTGMIVSGDTDHYAVDAGKLGLLRQAYTEAKYRAEAFRIGTDIQNKEIVKINGQDVVKLRVRMA
jgi:hypothetical protein